MAADIIGVAVAQPVVAAISPAADRATFQQGAGVTISGSYLHLRLPRPSHLAAVLVDSVVRVGIVEMIKSGAAVHVIGARAPV